MTAMGAGSCRAQAALGLAIRLSNSQDTVVAENMRTRVEAASMLNSSPQPSAIRAAAAAIVLTTEKDAAGRT